MSAKLAIVLFGAQASGKGSQGALLSEEISLPHISIGRLIRNLAKEDNDQGKKLKELIEKGQLVPNKLTKEILFKRLDKKDCEKGFILDGYPRSLNQAKNLETYLEDNEIDNVVVFNLNIRKEIITKRVAGRRVCEKCGQNYNLYFFPSEEEGLCDECGGNLIKRVDDTVKIVHERYKVFTEETVPAIEYYRRHEAMMFFDINGEKSIEGIFNDLIDILYDQFKN